MAATPEEAGTSHVQEQRNARNKNLRGAFFTSIVARCAGLFLQVLSLPIAAAALGPEGFIIYSMINATLAWLTLSNIGLGQATTLHIARRIDEKERIELFSASWVATTAISFFAILLTTGLALGLNLVPRIFSGHATELRSIYQALIFIAFVFVLTQNLSVFEAAQLAYQRQDRLNIAISIGTLLAAAAVYLAAKNVPTVLSILLAVHLPLLVMRILNAVITARMIGLQLGKLLSVRWRAMRSLFQDGLSFLTGSTVSNFLCHPFSILVVGATASAMTSASFAAVMNAVILASSIFGLVMTPVRGALPEAAQKADTAWIKQAYLAALKISVAYALVPCVLFSVFGQEIFEFWYRGTIFPQQLTLVPAGIYVICLSIEVTNYNFLSSLGQLKIASRWLLAKAVMAASMTLILTKNDQADLVFWSLVITSVLCSLIPLSLMIYHLIATPLERNRA